jgi:hypothetical protein
MKWMLQPVSFLVLVLLILNSCAPVGLVKPLEKNQKAITANLGGPMIKFGGSPIPMPLSSVGFSYGLSSKFTATSNLGLTALAFGVGQLDLGVLYGIKKTEGPGSVGFSAFGKTHLMLDKWEKSFRWYPEAGIQAYTEWGKNMLYAGGSGWLETRYPSVNRTAGNFWLPMIHAGFVRQNPKWNLSVELKWIAPNTSNEKIVVDYIGVAGAGAVGLYFGVVRKF